MTRQLLALAGVAFAMFAGWMTFRWGGLAVASLGIYCGV